MVKFHQPKHLPLLQAMPNSSMMTVIYSSGGLCASQSASEDSRILSHEIAYDFASPTSKSEATLMILYCQYPERSSPSRWVSRANSHALPLSRLLISWVTRKPPQDSIQRRAAPTMSPKLSLNLTSATSYPRSKDESFESSISESFHWSQLYTSLPSSTAPTSAMLESQA